MFGQIAGHHSLGKLTQSSIQCCLHSIYFPHYLDGTTESQKSQVPSPDSLDLCFFIKWKIEYFKKYHLIWVLCDFFLQSWYQVKWSSVQRMHSTHILPPRSIIHALKRGVWALSCAFLGRGAKQTTERRATGPAPQELAETGSSVPPSWPRLYFSALAPRDFCTNKLLPRKRFLITGVGVRWKVPPSLGCSFLGRVATNNIKVPFTSLLPNGLLPKIESFQTQKYITGSETKFISGDKRENIKTLSLVRREPEGLLLALFLYVRKKKPKEEFGK